MKLNAQMICPHCQTKGRVSTESTKVKQGLSGGKATKAHCGNCKAEWVF